MVAPLQSTIEATVDSLLLKFQTSPIQMFPYTSGVLDIYKQRTKTFGTPVTVVGRAILRPTPEQLSVIGNAEEYDIAFLFARPEMIRKFPAADEGQWIDVKDEMEWYGRRFKIEKAAPTGQVGDTFLLMVILAQNLPGERDG